MIEHCLNVGADWAKLQMFDARRLAIQRDDPTLKDLDLYEFEDSEWKYVMAGFDLNRLMVTVYSPADVIRAALLGFIHVKRGHAEFKGYGVGCPILTCARLMGLTFYQTWPHIAESPNHHNSMFCIPRYPHTLAEAKDAIDRYCPDSGYSDHTGPTPDAALYAIRKGAPLVEVHVHDTPCAGCADHAVSKDMETLALICKEAHK